MAGKVFCKNGFTTFVYLFVPSRRTKLRQIILAIIT